ncbi:MAG: acetate/propionate family kinase [Christensenellaceae bacterium]|jgi:acetate kinase
MKNILIINAGSSSLKYQLVDMETENVLAKGLVERIGIDHSTIKHKPSGKENVQIEMPIIDHKEAMEAVVDALTHKTHGVVKDLSTIVAVGHRVVHGGEEFSDSVLIDDGVINAIKNNIELAPLHNPANLMGIEACRILMPNVPNVAVFDTAFHSKMPVESYLYGVPYEVYTEYKVRRYGFHGTSHKYVSQHVADGMGKKIEDLKIITCHLGNGSSIAAVKNGVSVDTTMGFTPLEGLVMGTRSGDLDPAIVPYLMNKLNMTIDETMSYLNKKCGVLGISGLSSDFRDLNDAMDDGDTRAKAALDVFCYRIKKFIGAYIAAMNGVDVIAFAGGIGENDHYVRYESLKDMDFFGIKIDKSVNDGLRGKEAVISTADSKVKVIIIPTDEELMIARDTFNICCK